MSVYDGIPVITAEGLAEQKERRQIANSLMLLDEKLRYLFGHINEENVTADFRENYLVQGQVFRNYVKDVAGNFSAMEQEAEKIRLSVADAVGDIAALTLTANGLSTRVADAEGNLSTLTQTAKGLTARVESVESDATAAYSLAEQAADRFTWLVADGEDASEMILTDDFLAILSDSLVIDADVELYGLMTVWRDDDFDRAGGYMGYSTTDDLFSGNAEGIFLFDRSESCFVGAHESGVTLEADGYGAMLYYANGNFMPTTDDEQMMGDPNYRWQGVYAANGTIQTSDLRYKKDMDYELEKYEDFFLGLKPVRYRMKNGSRYHIGFLSQEVEENLLANGLTDMDFGGFIKTPKRTEQGEDYHYALRYGEFIALNTHMIQRLMERVTALEEKQEGGKAYGEENL